MFTAAERAYLQSQRLARLATIDSLGHPQNSPIGLHFKPISDTIDIIGWKLAASRKYRNVLANPHVALIVDDMPVDGSPRGIEIRGRAEARPATQEPGGSGTTVIRVHAQRIISWGLEPADHRPGDARHFPTGRDARRAVP
ncbi:MAG: PPOX class F420-dependent oxidoreductase [Frankia sp.]